MTAGLAPPNRRAWLVLTAIAAGWGSIGVFVRHAPLPATAIVALRLWLGAAVLGAVHLMSRRGRVLFPTRPGLAVASGVVQALHWLALVAALQRAPIGVVLLITYLAPVVVAAAARPVLGERVAPLTWAALGSGLAGLLLVLGAGTEAGDLSAGSGGLALAAVAGGSYAVLLLCGRLLAPDYGGVRLGVVQLGVAGLLVVPFALAADWGSPSWSWGWAVLVGLVHTGIATAAYLWCLGQLPATTAGVLLYVEPVSAVVFGWLLLDEALGPLALAGGLLVIAAGVMVVRSASTEVP